MMGLLQSVMVLVWWICLLVCVTLGLVILIDGNIRPYFAGKQGRTVDGAGQILLS
jgi:hypothetical protein